MCKHTIPNIIRTLNGGGGFNPLTPVRVSQCVCVCVEQRTGCRTSSKPPTTTFWDEMNLGDMKPQWRFAATARTASVSAVVWAANLCHRREFVWICHACGDRSVNTGVIHQPSSWSYISHGWTVSSHDRKSRGKTNRRPTLIWKSPATALSRLAFFTLSHFRDRLHWNRDRDILVACHGRNDGLTPEQVSVRVCS